ncbi:O-antigen ligase family protein [Rubrivirga sp. S365]|uniref:O-antigen ligase family protein n=1 Tax=Rubrivirga litoralis TaxID=3075598 RepID=A0ABU3BV67_9BACT|nr:MULTISPECIES: O-antigen ligase family protein [unclassified Rubrivirga]MDT0633175.1 O-antigen ligase family protein [Rubrivirga sp. F394]MDT7858010.1 O-antigen ligase family protein [Rubrivirga sp. S365]
MQAARPAPPPTPLASAAVLAGGAAVLGLAVWLAAIGSLAVWAVPVVIAVGLWLAVARPTPLARLTAVLVLLTFQFRGEQGTTALEVVSGLALVVYLAHWYVDVWLYRRRVVTSMFDVAALTWGAGGLVAGMVLGQLFGASAYDFRADVLATIPFLLYLPAKDLCARHRYGSLLLAGALVAYGVIASVQSALFLREVVTGATAVWEIADARFASSETSVTAGLLLSVATFATARGRTTRAVALALAGGLLGGLILSKSRGFWVAAVLGLVALGVVGRSADRRRLVLAAVLGTTALVALSLLLFADQISLIVDGSLNRLATLATAGQDISLLNRFAETDAAWERIRANPVLGYGWGVQFSYYGLISHETITWAFLHNGYVSLWYKTGLWGLLLMMTVWTGGVVRGAAAGRSPRLAARERACALGAMATLVAFSLAAITSGPFSILDQMLVVTLTLALAHGVADRARALSAPPDAASRRSAAQ